MSRVPDINDLDIHQMAECIFSRIPNKDTLNLRYKKDNNKMASRIVLSFMNNEWEYYRLDLTRLYDFLEDGLSPPFFITMRESFDLLLSDKTAYDLEVIGLDN